MILRLCALLSIPALLPAADDPWAKVKDLKSGQELRIIRKGVPRPVLAQYDDLTDDHLMVVMKNEQQAIPRAEVDRIDARPIQTKSRVKVESKSETKDPEPSRSRPNETSAPTTNSTSNVVMSGKPDFETVYRRTASVPKSTPN